jgi:heat shock protein HslJ
VRAPTAALLAVLISLIGACQAHSPLPGREARRVDLENRDLISSRLEYQGEPVELLPGQLFGTPTLVVRFFQTSIEATGGCNWYSVGSWDIDEGRLIVPDEFAATLMGCPQTTDSQDRWFADFLSSEPTVRLDGERYVLVSGDSRVTFLETDVDRLQP